MKGPVGDLRALVLPALSLLLASLMLVLPGSATAKTTATVPGDPLQMTITSMTPSVVPTGGDPDEDPDDPDPDDAGAPADDTITLSGEITNTSDETWRDIRVYPRISHSAITTSEELRAAVTSDPRLVFGDRITTPGAFDDEVADLEPGATTTWRIDVPAEVLRARMSLEDGVYQVGVQALGANDQGRSSVANGRARTFITLMSEDQPTVPASLVVPIRRGTQLADDGRIADEERWARDLRPGGRLANLVNLMATAQDVPLTWLLDPAVLDGVQLLSRGNPMRTLSGSRGQSPDDVDPEEHPAAQPAADWLEAFTTAAEELDVLALPYGDLDLAAAARHHAGLHTRARALSDAVLADLDLTSTPAVASPTGHLPPEALELLDDEETLLVGASGTSARDFGDLAPPVVQIDGTPAVLFEDAVNISNTADTDTGATVRQRILAEGAIRSLAGDRSGMVVNLAPTFDPGLTAPEFLAGLVSPHLEWTELSAFTGDAEETEETEPVSTSLNYPRAQADREIGESTVEATLDLLATGSRLADVLTSNDQLATELDRLAVISTSYHARSRQDEVHNTLVAATEWSRSQLGRITIDTPSFVILAAESGAFAIKINNRLNHEVTVTIVARTRDDLTIEAPSQIVLGPESTRTVTLNAQASSIGVHPVSLQVADPSGRAFGEQQEINIRSNTVGRVIWVILGAGVGILALAIAIRWVRRLRGRGARDGGDA